MTILRVGVVVLFATACFHRAYVPAGAPPAFNASGVYAMGEELYSSNCGPITTRTEAVRVEVQHPAGSAFGKFIISAHAYDMELRSDGNFTVRQDEPGQSVNSTTIAGRFNADGFYARVNVTTSVPPVLRDPVPRMCTYQLRWTGKKL
jgi:hypothetical protein